MNLLIFIIVQMINVVMGTIKYVCTVKSSPSVAALTNALSYTFNAVLTIILVQQSMWVAIAVTFISNLIGVPIGRFIVDAFTKDRLWIYTATLSFTLDEARDFREYLETQKEIKSNFQEISYDEVYSFTIYSHSKDESRKIVKELADRQGKYHIVEAI